MFVYVAKRFTHAIVSTRVIPVTCEKCACSYRYQAVRRGEGTATAPYYIDVEGAERRARRRAEAKAKKRIESAVDPVPCPACGWIQSTMVDELRRRAYRWMPWIGGAIGVALLMLTPLVNHIIDTLGAKTEQTVFTIAAVIVAMGMIPASLFLRRVLMKRIDPNSSFPAAPAPILGAPRGYIVGANDAPIETESAASLVVESPGKTLAYESSDPQLTAGGWYTAQLLGLRFPAMCGQCATPTSRNVVIKQIGGMSSVLASIAVPMCPTCVRAAKRRRAIIYGVGIGIVIAVALAAGIFIDGRPGSGIDHAMVTIFPMALIIGIPLYFARQIKPPVKFSGFSAARNTVQIRFKNETFMQAFVAESLKPQPMSVAPAQGMADATRQLAAATARARAKRQSQGFPSVDA